MSREVRRVPADWQHPLNGTYERSGKVRYVALFDGADFAGALADWEDGAAKWGRGEFPEYASEDSRQMSYTEWAGCRPDPAHYMPAWTPEQAIHFMMYETTSEGTPISPGFATPEELARWLVDNNASAFAGGTASYEAWLRVANGGFAPSAIFTPETGLVSGVEALTKS